jgi:hypothetical protein
VLAAPISVVSFGTSDHPPIDILAKAVGINEKSRLIE